MKDRFIIPENAICFDRSEKSEHFSMDRLFIQFQNGNELSIIKGIYSYGGAEGFYEIMPTDKNDCLKNTDLEIIDDSVKGWLSIEEVNQYIAKLN